MAIRKRPAASPRKSTGCHWRFCRSTALWRTPPWNGCARTWSKVPEARHSSESRWHPIALDHRVHADRIRNSEHGPDGESAGRARTMPAAQPLAGFLVEDQERIARIRDLLKTPAAPCWVCFEPLLGQVIPDAVPVGDGYFDSVAGGDCTIEGVVGRSPSMDPHGSRSTGWSRAERSAPGRARRIRTLCACSATNALRPTSPSSSGNGGGEARSSSGSRR
jgi:hypothetical protein